LSGSNVRAEYLLFAKNNASYGGGVSLMPGSKRNSIVETMDIDSRFLCFECVFSNNTAEKSGGGLNIQSQDGGVLVVAQLHRCRFEDNSASVFGGGIYFERPFDQIKCNTSWTSCAHLVIVDSTFRNNEADRSGGSLLSNDRDRILFSCSQSTDDSNSHEFIDATKASSLRAHQQELWPQGYCPQWISAENGTKNSSSLVSSYVRECKITEVEEDNFSENSTETNNTQINETVPGANIPDIYIKCFDDFGNQAQSGNDSLTGTLSFNIGGNRTMIFTTDLKDGVWNITGVRNPSKATFNSSYSYKLEILFNFHWVPNITVLVNVRECRINEQKDDKGVQCKECDATEYNFDPMRYNCKHCDETLDCSGTYVFPKDGFWHSSPCHVPAQKCLTAYACEETAKLQKKIKDSGDGKISSALKYFSCTFSDNSTNEYQKLQCKEVNFWCLLHYQLSSLLLGI